MSLPSLGRVKTQLKWKGYMYAQPFESLYNTNHPIDVCFLLLSVREGLEKGWNISYWEYAHTKSAQVFLLVASSSLVRCGKCSGLLAEYVCRDWALFATIRKLSLTWFAYQGRHGREGRQGVEFWTLPGSNLPWPPCVRPDDMPKRYLQDSREQ